MGRVALGHDLQRVIHDFVRFEAHEFWHGEQLVEDFKKVFDVAFGVVSMPRHDLFPFGLGFSIREGTEARRTSPKLTAGERSTRMRCSAPHWRGQAVELQARLAIPLT